MLINAKWNQWFFPVGICHFPVPTLSQSAKEWLLWEKNNCFFFLLWIKLSFANQNNADLLHKIRKTFIWSSQLFYITSAYLATWLPNRKKCFSLRFNLTRQNICKINDTDNGHFLYTYSDWGQNPETVRLVLVLLNLTCDFGHFPPLAEINNAFWSVRQKIWVAFLS